MTTRLKLKLNPGIAGPKGETGETGPSASGIINLTGANNSGAPTTKFDLTADAVLMRDASGSPLYKDAPGTLTCDVTVAGPAANGRDQAGAFSLSSWVHIHFIGKLDGTTALIASASASAPAALPAGYTYWKYAATVRLNGSSQIVSGYIRGDTFFYQARQGILTNGNATSATAIDVSSYVPPNAKEYDVHLQYFGATPSGGIVTITTKFQILSGTDYAHVNLSNSASGGPYWVGPVIPFPNVGQQFYYYSTVSVGSSPIVTLSLPNYKIPNGAS